ncbi:hypothetical protein VE01_00324 [Pseudogymnoascus verrucosus]|uniref:Uncharacterized protein n=1 Tax=Pseudogymnoascus verrucosus TaxID=342668 RepID=A0A2P2SXJ9_9PEZI|nr:uncharacterized protein VE01_00324 [Pseudogymnoascus verrucosus]OBU01582.1 hypothetical protein VE01_00324 [Pseudogymnoascus verrucosus]
MFHIGTQLRRSHAASSAVHKQLAMPFMETGHWWYSSHPTPLNWKIYICYEKQSTPVFFGLETIEEL